MNSEPALPSPLPDALLCDMDGTLVDTEREWLEALAELLGAHGAAPEPGELAAAFAGLPLPDAAALVAARVPLTAAEAREVLDRTFTERVEAGVTIQPGALALLDGARELGIPVGLVTASERSVAELVLHTLGRHRFACTVTADETPRSKPHPDPYLAAAADLGVAPAGCLAVEDTPTGVASALDAGCRVLAVPTVAGISTGPRTTVTTTLEGVDLAALPAL